MQFRRSVTHVAGQFCYLCPRLHIGMHPDEARLEGIVRRWLSAHAAGTAVLSIEPPNEHGPARLEIRPSNRAAPTVKLSLGDTERVSVGFGEAAWWSDEIALADGPLWEVLSAIASGRVREEVRRIGTRVVAHRCTVELQDGNRLTYGSLSPFAVVPGLKWESIPWQPFAPHLFERPQHKPTLD